MIYSHFREKLKFIMILNNIFEFILYVLKF